LAGRVAAGLTRCTGETQHDLDRHLVALGRHSQVSVCPPAGVETKRSRPSRCDRYLATSCPLTLLPAASSSGAKVPAPPLRGETVTRPPPMPLWPGGPTS